MSLNSIKSDLPDPPHKALAMANGDKSPDKSVMPTRERRQARYTQAFAQIIAVMMRDRHFRNVRIADLEWLVLPPVIAGQWRLCQGQLRFPESGATSEAKAVKNTSLVPVAAVLWARVSPAIDEQLSADLDKPVRLRADQWASGDRLWLMAAAGDQRYMPAFLEQLNRTEFKGVPVKLRMRGADGKASLALLDQIVVTRHGSIGP